jgi:prevent-host-death family protein
MKTYTSLDLQQRTGDIQRAAVVEPVLITSHGRPRMIISSVEEFVRLKEASGEPVPEDVLRERKAIERRGLPADPLGYLRYEGMRLSYGGSGAIGTKSTIC